MERIQKVSENLADFEIDSENLEQFLCAYSQKMKDVATEIRLYAPLDFPVVIEGASGTGKEVIATALHKLSGRSPFIVINMGEGPETLFESAIFGHKKGAFTGADQERTGFIGQAKNGTVFMDEINSLPRSLQPKLLRVLENGTYWPVGSSKIEKTQARFIFSSNQSLEELKSRGDLREDIFYRLGRIIRIPSLRERREDIPPITEKLLRIAKMKIDRGGGSLTKKRFSDPDLPVVTEAAMNKLKAYHWPGNIRQLKMVLERALLLSREGKIRPEYLELPYAEESLEDFNSAMEKFATEYFDRVGQIAGNNIKIGMEITGMTETTYRRKMRKFGKK